MLLIRESCLKQKTIQRTYMWKLTSTKPIILLKATEPT